MTTKKQRKKRNIIIIVILLVIIAILFSLGNFLSISTIGDKMQVYDGFSAGLRHDLWEFHSHSENVGFANTAVDKFGNEAGVTINNGWLINRQSFSGVQNALFFTETTSKRLWATENLKFKYRVFSNNDNIVSNSGSASFGGKPIQLNSVCQGSGNQRSPLKCKGEGIIEIKRIDDQDLTKYAIIPDGDESRAVFGTNAEPVSINFWGTIEIDYLRYKPYLSCRVNSTEEVEVRVDFSPGSVITTEELKKYYFNPLSSKFCTDDLGVIISEIDGGSTRELGSITNKIASGEPVTVPSTQSYSVRFYTPYKEGIQNICSPGQWIDGRTGECAQFAKEAPVIIIIEKEIEVEVPVSKKEIINTGIGELTFQTKAGLNIADKLWQVNGVNILSNQQGCQVEEGKHLSLTLFPNCYSANVIWAGFEFTVKNQEKFKLNDNLFVTYNLEGRGALNTNGDYDFDETPQHFFTVSFENIFDIEIKDYQLITQLNSEKIICFDVINNLFDLESAGYKIKISRNIIDQFGSFEELKTGLIKGKSSFCVNMPTDILGRTDPEILIYFDMIENKQYIGDEKITLPYFVQETEPTINPEVVTTEVIIEKTIKEQLPEATEEVEKEFPIMQTVFIVLIILSLLIFVMTRKKKKG